MTRLEQSKLINALTLIYFHVGIPIILIAYWLMMRERHLIEDSSSNIAFVLLILLLNPFYHLSYFRSLKASRFTFLEFKERMWQLNLQKIAELPITHEFSITPEKVKKAKFNFYGLAFLIILLLIFALIIAANSTGQYYILFILMVLGLVTVIGVELKTMLKVKRAQKLSFTEAYCVSYYEKHERPMLQHEYIERLQRMIQRQYLFLVLSVLGALYLVCDYIFLFTSITILSIQLNIAKLGFKLAVLFITLAFLGIYFRSLYAPTLISESKSK